MNEIPETFVFRAPPIRGIHIRTQSNVKTTILIRNGSTPGKIVSIVQLFFRFHQKWTDLLFVQQYISVIMEIWWYPVKKKLMSFLINVCWDRVFLLLYIHQISVIDYVECETISERRESKWEGSTINFVPRRWLTFKPIQPCHHSQNFDQICGLSIEFHGF